MYTTESTFPPTEHLDRILLLADRLSDILASADSFDLTAEGDFMQIRIQDWTGKELLEAVAPR